MSPTKYRIKIVPDSEPNAEGRYVEVQTYRTLHASGWAATELFFSPYVPPGEHLVQCERVYE